MLWPMTMLVTVPELALWAEGDSAAIPADDPLAIWLLDSASALVMDECGFTDWTPETTPVRAKIVIANIAKRCWNNADQETRSSIAGGPSSAVLDEAALGLRLSDAEIAECAKIGEKLGGATLGGGVWTLTTTRGDVEMGGLVPDSRWPQSSPINYYGTADAFLWPMSDGPLQPTNVPDEPTNTVL